MNLPLKNSYKNYFLSNLARVYVNISDTFVIVFFTLLMIFFNRTAPLYILLSILVFYSLIFLLTPLIPYLRAKRYKVDETIFIFENKEFGYNFGNYKFRVDTENLRKVEIFWNVAVFKLYKRKFSITLNSLNKENLIRFCKENSYPLS